MKSLKQSYAINVPSAEVWKALVNPKSIDQWGAGPAKMSEKEGFKFKLWGGSIFGVNKRVVNGKELAQEWLAEGFKQPSYVVISLRPMKHGLKTKSQGVGTRIQLEHQNIPEDMYEDIKTGWRHYYFGPMKQYLEDRYGNPDVDYHQGG